jgi:phytoene dehydrogenase-like protein
MQLAKGGSGPDAVVIGAGHNGLVAANLLLDAGWEVVLCEATPHIGGAVRSAEVTAPGYLSDLFSAFYPLAIASPVLRSLALAEHGLQWTHAPQVLAHVFPDDRCAVLSRDVEETAASVSAFAATDGPAWRALAAEWDEIEAAVLETLFTPLPALRPARRLLSALGAGGTLRMARRAVLPVRRFGSEAFAGDGAQLLLAGNALHADLSPDSAGSGLYGWLLTMLGQSFGFPVPVGGAGQLSAALARRFLAGGGVIRLDAPVDAIEVVAGRATAVRLASGERLAAGRAVVADVTAPTLYRDLVGPAQLPGRFLRDLDAFEWDTPTLKIDWALREPIGWTAAGAGQAGTVHLGADLDGLTRYAADLATKTIPENPFLLLGQMTTSDPSRSPAGTESAWAYTHLPIGVPLTDSELEAHVRRVEAVIEARAPGFGELIVGRHVQSPALLAAENPSLVHGAINGGTAQLHQQLIFRPTVGLGGASGPIDRLFLAGASAHPGGGVHGGPGANAAHAALSRERRLGPVRRRATTLMLDRIYAVGNPPPFGRIPTPGD